MRETNNHPPLLLYKTVDCDSGDFLSLSNELDDYLDNAIGGAKKREKYKDFNHLDTMDYVIVAYSGKIPVGCGALRECKWEEKKRCIEIKRIFVKKEYRTQGVATGIMQRLLGFARKNNYEEVLLETGEFLENSLKLYTRFGFERIPNYGVYADMKESVCMGKQLAEIRYSEERTFNEKEVQDLYESVGWMSAKYPKRLLRAFQSAGAVISAWDNNRLIGLAEVIDDKEMTAYIHYLLVRPEYQRQGIGSRLLEFIKEKYKNYLYLIVIAEEKELIEFYKCSGFIGDKQKNPLFIINTDKI